MTHDRQSSSTLHAPPVGESTTPQKQESQTDEFQHESPILKVGDQLLRLHHIIGSTGQGLLPFSRSTFYEKIKTGELPKGIKLSKRVSCWRKSDILAFIEKMAVQNDL
jgi:predicted DNA-binding transcriptional regulator AlpA